jgi:predicted transcriptional regulator
MSKPKPMHDPRGHSLRIYDDIYDSAAFASLSPHDVLAYLALLRELKQFNNGDLSLPVSRSKTCGIKHPKTLARSLRALCAVGLVDVTRKGGCAKGGQRLANLYRVTDRDCYDLPKKFIEAKSASNEWKRVTSVQQGLDLIAAAEKAAKEKSKKLKGLGHAVPPTMAPREVVEAKTMAPREPWDSGLGHGVNMAETPANPMPAGVSSYFGSAPEKTSHRAPHSTPLYVANPGGGSGAADCHGIHRRWSVRPANLFTSLIH